jgi:hypothetical protein
MISSNETTGRITEAPSFSPHPFRRHVPALVESSLAVIKIVVSMHVVHGSAGVVNFLHLVTVRLRLQLVEVMSEDIDLSKSAFVLVVLEQSTTQDVFL